MRKPLALAIVTLLSLTLIAAEHSSPPIPAPEILGIRLAMPYAQAHAQLAKLGQMKKEEEGQEVWTLLGDEHYQYLIVGFDTDRKVRYVTALAAAEGTPLAVVEVGDLHSATRRGQPGNLTFTWKGKDPKSKFEYLAIAKGKDPQRLASYSVKRLGIRMKEKD